MQIIRRVGCLAAACTRAGSIASSKGKVSVTSNGPLFSVMIFNYVQHVHTDEESSYNHARNFVGLINPALFNNGYHTIHHKSPGIHWSETPAAQREIQMLIDPLLSERSFWWYMVRVYLLAPFHSRFGTVSKRLERINSQAASVVSEKTFSKSLDLGR